MRHGAAEPSLDAIAAFGKVLRVKYSEYVGLLLAVVGTICWAICFWWMHRISHDQHAMLKELHAVAERIEAISKAEHELISEVHPTVEKIKSSVEDVAVAVAGESRSGG